MGHKDTEGNERKNSEEYLRITSIFECFKIHRDRAQYKVARCS